MSFSNEVFYQNNEITLYIIMNDSVIRTLAMPNVNKDVDQINPHSLLVGMQTITATLKGGVCVPVSSKSGYQS